MSKVLAAIDDSAASHPVLTAALALAPRLGAEVEAVHVTDDGGRTAEGNAARHGVPVRHVNGDPLEVITDLVGDSDVVAVALGTRGRPSGRRRIGHLAEAVASATDKPVLVVPPDARPAEELHTVLLAMEGTPEKSRTAKRAVELASAAGLEVVVVHVDDEESIPAFSDQVQHETEAYADEFLARHVHGAPKARLELRIGVPADEVIAAADALGPELLAVGWPHTDDPARGQVAHEIVERSHIPVLLVAVS